MRTPVPATAKLVPRELLRRCPKCGRYVKVGGPFSGKYVIQAHAFETNGTVMCSGYNMQIPATPASS